ncbi:MAG: biopolymer transporter ExbD [Pirellulaceae bacterium]|nr:biopolymer transporter ExbD [Pirellulaceae bacterium]
MRLKRHQSEIYEGDLTPMIDMTFQLIAFFMVLINFTDTAQDERVKLPSSQLAKPPEAPLEIPIVLQMTKEGHIIYQGRTWTVDQFKPQLISERQFLEYQKKSVADATIIIRADVNAKTGIVQKLIEACQEAKFEKFALRAKQEEV